MGPEPVQERALNEVVDEIDWEKLGVEGVEGKAEVTLPARRASTRFDALSARCYTMIALAQA